jgi:hypothetical protein
MSGIWSLQEGMWNAIKSDGTLAPKLKGKKVYSLRLPEGDVGIFPCVVLGQSVEMAERTFDVRMDRGIETIDVWSTDLSKYETANIAADLERIFDNTEIILPGRIVVLGLFNVLTIIVDPSWKYSHAVCRYEVLHYGV